MRKQEKQKFFCEDGKHEKKKNILAAVLEWNAFYMSQRFVD